MRPTPRPMPHVYPEADDAVEVYALYRDVVIGARHLDAGDAFVVGSDARADAPIAPDAVPSPAFPLVSSDETGATVEVTPAMDGEIVFEDRTVALAEYVRDNGLRFAPPPRSRVEIRCGASTFRVRLTSRAQRLPRPAWRWRAVYGYFAGTAAVIAALLGAAMLVPGTPQAISGDTEARARAMLIYQVKPPVLPPTASGGDSARATTAAAPPRPRATVTPPRRGTPQGVARPADAQAAREQARTAGILGIFRSVRGASWEALLGSDGAGLDPTAILGELQGVDLAMATQGGPTGTGSDPAGTGQRTIGDAPLTTISGAPGGPGRDYGGEASRLPPRRPRQLAVQVGHPTVRGALDRDIIRRVIRRNLNQVKFCYERALVAKPSLAGRVTVQFTIGGAGRVMAAAVQESTVGDTRVESCVREAVARWEFPQPQGGGIVIVSYPFVLVPAGG